MEERDTDSDRNDLWLRERRNQMQQLNRFLNFEGHYGGSAADITSFLTRIVYSDPPAPYPY